MIQVNQENPPRLFVQFSSLFQPNNPYWIPFILLISVLTSLIIWFNYGRMFDAQSVNIIWHARYQAESFYQYFLKPFALFGDWGVVIYNVALQALIVLYFYLISHMVGIGRKTFFVLFLLLNFLPEMNQTRFVLDPYMVSVLLWLISIYWFIKNYSINLYKAFAGWALIMWISAFFSVESVFWAVLFPLCFIFWPGSARHWSRLLPERLKFLLCYYVLVAIIIFFIPLFRTSFVQFFTSLSDNYQNFIFQLSHFLDNDMGNNLSIIEVFVIACALVALNAIKISNILIVGIAYLGFKNRQSTVFTKKVKLFFIFCLFFFLFIHAFSLLYEGHLQASNHYFMIVVLILWLSSTGAYIVLQKIGSGKLSPQFLLVASWILVAIAIISMFKFGPTGFYQRQAGQWITENNPHAKVISNSAIVLYYADENPSNKTENLVNQMLHEKSSQKNQYYVIVQSLKMPLSPALANDYQIVKSFSNNSNNVAYILVKND